MAIKFNAKHFNGRTQSQRDLIAGTAECGAKWGTRAVPKTECKAPVTMLRQEGRRRWVIDGFCEVHGSLTKDLSERENVYESWAMLADVMPVTRIEARA